MTALVPKLYQDLLNQARSHRIQVNDLKVQLYVWGHGEPCFVLLHGGYGSWAHWIRVIPELAKRATVVVPDMPGFGRSDTPPEPHSAEGVAEILAVALDRVLDTRAYTLAGFSFGGAIAGQLALQRPDRVQCLFLLGPGGLGAPRGTMPDLVKRTRDMTRAEVVAAHRRNLEILMVADPASIDDLALYIQENNTALHRLKSRPISATNVLARALPEIRCPIRFLFGTRDASVGEYLEARLQIIADAAPHAEVELLPDQGHWLMWEVSELVVDRLQSVSAY